jgi:eukaryotic-like serine/threonine-protein kinase
MFPDKGDNSLIPDCAKSISFSHYQRGQAGLPEVSMSERDLFIAALQIKEPVERSAWLDRECGGDTALRQRIDVLLQALDKAGSLLESPAVAVGPTIDAPTTEAPGNVVGPYKLLEVIGEGGMGTVWMAQQSEPIKRLVAIKLIKPGMDSKQVLARFDAERQALALMDHPNIAKVFDAGTTSEVRGQKSEVSSQKSVVGDNHLTSDLRPLTSGVRPYFVMELVKGVPITKYCDEHHLTPRQRLELFIPVCQAIQHAHQKGIIHRDIKPSNVLVAMYDDRPVPKVIDFGVAKATGVQLTEETLDTGFGAIVGTLEYMSPEQAEFNQLDIDTRSDIYSLGVLLYELLAGSPPFSRKDLEKAGMLEMLRVIREQEPSKPSTKLSTADGLPMLATNRSTEPAKLPKLVKGELDWIVMKCLEKDRNRRYETANDFAMDLQRYLADEPVQASPLSTAYRLRKFVRRNKRAVLALTAIFLLLFTGITGTTWGLVRAEKSRQEENRQRRLAEAAVSSERTAKEAESEQRNRAETALQKAAREAAVAAAINDFLNKDILQLSSPFAQATPGLTPDANLRLRTVLQRAAQRIDGKFVDEPEVEMKLRYTIGYALQGVQDHAGALAQYQKVVPWFQETLGPDHPEALLAEYRMACTHRALRHYDIALSLHERNLEKHKAVLGLQHAQTLASMSGLAMACQAVGQKERARQLFEETLELRKRHLGPAHPDTLVSMSNMAVWHLQQMQIDKALPLFEETLEGMQKKLTRLHPERLNTTRNLARAYYAAEQLDKAIPLQERVTSQFTFAYGIDIAMTQDSIDDLVAYYVDIGWCDKAQALLIPIQSGPALRLPVMVSPTILNQRPLLPQRLDPGLLDARMINVNQRQDLRVNRYRELIQRVRPAADKYQQELAAKQADHPDTLAARQAFAVVLRAQNRLSGSAYHLKAVRDARQRLLPADHPDLLACQLELGVTRLQQAKFAEADSLLRDYRAARKEQAPAQWTTFYAESLHGAALLGQKKFAEAEPLLLEGYAGMKQRESESPTGAKARLIETLQRLVQLYDGWGKKEKADEWRKKLEAQKK